MYSVYNLLFLALLLLLSPYIAVRWILDSEEWRLRLGYLPKSRQKGALWLHGASVGEIGSLAPLVSQVRALLPETPIVVSAMTKTGRERAIRELNEADLIVLSPIDFPLFVRRTLEALKPNAVIIAETELWPNLVRQARSAGAKVAMVSGRISEESLPRYRQFRRFFRTVLSNFTLLCVQSDEDRERFLELGAHPDRVVVAGSLKSDACLRTVPVSRSELGLPDGVPIFVAGSTRPGEEEVLFGAFKEVRRSWQGLRLIVAPRHLHRVREVGRLASELGLSVRRRSERASSPEVQVLLLDSVGELPQVYGAGTISFVGGTLLPYGGHNLLEPAFHSLPVVFGPYTQSMKEVASRLLETGGGVEVRDQRELSEVLLRLLTDPAERERRGEAALGVARERAGGTAKTLALLKSYGVI